MAAKTTFTLYHNPRCSKSRAALALLQDRGIEPIVIEYLKTPPTAAELQALLKKLHLTPAELVRKGEDIYKSKFAGKHLTDQQWIDVMVEHPILIERPIAISGSRAVIGRPPEKVVELL